jgi:translocation and assembly module TamB
LRGVVPGLEGDTGIVQPRPGILARRLRTAREDSVRVARATEIERLVTGRRMPLVVVDTPRAIPRGALSGSLFTAGTAVGNVRDFDLRGRAGGENVIAKGSYAKSIRSEYAWTNARTPQSSLALGLQGDSVSAYGFAFDTVDARIAYGADKRGRVELVARQGPERDYAVRGNFVFHPEHNELHVANATFRFDTTAWVLAQPAAIQWGSRGIAVQNVDLRNGEMGRVWVNGLLPTEGTANLDLALDDVQVAHLADIAQTDVDLSGRLTLRGHLDGTLRDPRFRGAFGIPDAAYGGTLVPELRGTFNYANRSLGAHVLAVRGDSAAPLAVIDASVPINLAMADVRGDRFSGEGLRIDVAADSLPLDLIPRFTEIVHDVRGFAAGRVLMSGSFKRPQLIGALAVRNAEATIAATGARITGINGAVRMVADSVRIDSLVGHSKGEIRLTGGLAVGNWREPAFDLHLVASDAKVLDDDRGELFADVALALTGPFRQSYLAGKVTVRSGVIYIPEMRDVQNIAAGDPALFSVLDTALVAERELLPAESPLFDNLRLDVDVQVNRNTWVRTRDANIEIFSDGFVHASRERLGGQRAALALTGIIGSDRGEYRLFSKRFQVKRGSAVFLGGSELNPTLQLTAEYEARPPGREAVNVRIVLGGTLNAPRLSLESDAQPPLSQTDLLSFLAFGRESGSLLDFEGSPLSSKSGSQSLAGVGKVAGRRLASVALGLAVDEVEGDAGRDLGVDVINITPEDMPTDFGSSGVQDFLLGTRIEAGKYVNPQTFVAVYGSPSIVTGRGQAKAPPGVRLEHRAGKGWRIVTSLEPRLRLRQPTFTVTDEPISPVSVFGLFFTREWRF